MALYKIRAQLIQELEEPVDHLEGAQSHHEEMCWSHKTKTKICEWHVAQWDFQWATAIFYLLR